MAKIKTNPVLEQIRGKVGDLVFKRYNQEIIMTRSPRQSGKAPTASQLAVRENFRLATVYGKSVMADPKTLSLYETKARAQGTPVFALAVADFFNAPAVDEIDLSNYTGKTGETIHIRASDDFEVAGVGVVIHNAGGAVLEQGAATASGDGTWNYTATTNLPAGQTVSIDVTATDLPGHKTTKSQTKS
jgi:hypothetical protein